jgi:serine/threonine protein kinase/Tol biopolymer transport system component
MPRSRSIAMMSSHPVKTAERIRFGGDFELDLRAYELRRAGRVLKLERIPMELLLFLIESHEYLVTREQIIERLWGKDVFLNTDGSINAAIRKIRQALKDDPEDPRFLQTVTGRGYRFIAPITMLGPAREAETVEPSDSRLENLAGRKISHYRILQVLGGGGMGVVYQAEDLKLGRRVAIKFLPAEMGTDAKAFGRIEREARAASALEHPNICPIYELGEHDGQPFIVMQLLEGQTLREWIERSAGLNTGQRLRALLPLGVQIADGLETAHQKGIIHRDIKPANLFITNRGEAKILDFGVAKFLDRTDGASHGLLGGAAVTDKIPHPAGALPDASLTETGASVGTPCYASPEQVRGDKLDARTDLFSLGLVLYEAATGKQAFVGNTATEIRGAVINQPTVPLGQINRELPAELERIVGKALEKDREQRYRTAADLRQDLLRLQREVDSSLADRETCGDSSATAEIPRRRKTAVVARPLIALAVLLAAGFGVYWFVYRTGPQPFKDFTVTQITNTGKAELAAISPDGKYVLHLQNDNGMQSLRLRNIATGSDAQVVAPTPARYKSLIFSPDGNYVYFRQLINSTGSDWDVYRMPVLGGMPQLVARDVDSDITFSPDARRVAYVRANDPEVGKYRLLSANPDGGEETILAIENIEGVGNEAYPPFAAWSGDGKEIAYSYAKMTDQPGAIKAFDLASRRFSVLERFPNSLTFELCWPAKRRWLMLLRTENGPNFASPQIAAVSVQDGKLYPVTRDTNSYSTLTLSADGKTAATVQVKITETLDLLPGSGESGQTAAGPRSQLDDVSAFDWSSDEKLIVSDGSQLLRLGRDNVRELALTSDPGAAVLSLARCSNSYVLVSWAYYGGRDNRAIWRINPDGSDPKQLSNGSYDIAPSCSPDGHWAYYVDGLRTLMRVPVDGGRPEIVPGSKVPNSDRLLGSGDFSPDGRSLVLIADTYDPVSQRGQAKLAIVALDSSSASEAAPHLLDPHPGIVAGSVYTGGARFSPDGKSVVYVIRENGIGNLWMQPIDGGPGRRITKFTSGLIAGFRWSPNGKTLAVMRRHNTSDVVVLRDTTE